MIFITKVNLTTSGAQQKAKRSHFETSRQFLATTTNRRNYKIKLDLRKRTPTRFKLQQFLFSLRRATQIRYFSKPHPRALINHPIFVEETNFEKKF